MTIPHLDSPLFESLPESHRPVAALLVDAKSPKEIASILQVHISYVSYLSVRTRKKLGVQTVAELIKWFWQNIQNK